MSAKFYGRHIGVSMISMLVALGATSAFAQQANGNEKQNETVGETVVVTGSSLRGVAPVGSSLTTVGRAQLDNSGVQTMQQALKTVPAVVGLGAAGQGGFGSFDGAGTNAPTIHGLGASASNSTLVLINGHRIPLTGVNHALGDPNIVSPLGLERVEVLADGASSVYGSDAVAGVVNFITRRKFDGFEANIQTGVGDSYYTYNGAFIGGKRWDTGAFLLAGNYSFRSNLNAGDRDYTNGDHRALGGTNRATNNCSPATISSGGITYVAPYASTNIATSTCSYPDTWDLLPEETRYGIMASLEQELSDSIKFSADLMYSSRESVQQVSRGVVSGVTVFNTTAQTGLSYTVGSAQINPFYVAPTGVSNTRETVSYDFNQLLGTGASVTGGAETLYFAPSFDYKINDNWHANFGMVLGRDRSYQVNDGQVCASCVNLVLNGSARTDGNTGIVIPLTTIAPTLALTSANALDVWNSGSANRTSAATLKYITDNHQYRETVQTLVNYYAKIDGELFNLPAGAVKLAAGVEGADYTISQDTITPLGAGAASLYSRNLHLDYERQVRSAFLELFVPVVGEDQNIPLMQKLDLNISGRIDDYSDFGQTTNPKVAFNWTIIDGLKFRGNWAESFVAPALTSIGISDGSGTTAETSIGLLGTSGTITLPYSIFSSLAGTGVCPAASSTVTGCTINQNQIMTINGGNGTLKPQTGEAFSLGVDYRPSFVPGLSLGVTYWENKLRNGITAPNSSISATTGALASRYHLYSAGATSTQITTEIGTRPVLVAQPGTVYGFYDNTQGNVLNLDVAGWDIEGHYRLNTDFGRFTFDGSLSLKTKFDQYFGADGAKFSVLGTTGYNLTFPSVEKEGRLSVGYSKSDFSSLISFNYTGEYTYWGSSAVNPVVSDTVTKTPIRGGDVIDSNTTIDLNISYKFHDIGPVEQVTAFIDITNLFDEEPPFVNIYGVDGASGYDNSMASPIGRVITIGLRTKF